jgi:hypothetical protein
MKKTLTLIFSLFVLFKAPAQTSCPNISIDSFSDNGCALSFSNSDPLNTIKQVECNGLSGAISGSADIWMQKQTGIGGGTTADAGYYGTGAFDFSSGGGNISSLSVTYDGADGNTDPDNPNISGPVLGDFTGKTIQFLATIDNMGDGKFISLTVSVWDGAGNKSQATLTVNGPTLQIDNANYNLGALLGTANLADIRAVQFKQDSNQGGMDNSIAQLSAVCTGNSPLPVVLIDFAGSVKEGNANLTWSTSSEVNTNRFEIETSSNGKEFSKLGEVLAKGNSGSRSNYAFKDENQLFNRAYYRLKMIDNDESYG